MSTITVLLYILFVAAAIILTVVILLQEGKGGGFGDALGAAGQQAFGVKASGVQRFTMWVAIAFLGSAVAIHILNNKRQTTGDFFDEDPPVGQVQDTVPVTPPAGGGAPNPADKDG